ncbi:MAG: fluoride efflux transporter CrcB [Ottowia sp.]|jgi:CrcB protein|nr:fluoride efflux transporter CrcB [Ottowia sp.]MBP7454775.1 fluoride efflux transporter CrcB [Ottowia sp.]MBP7457657.1 fluoride efflux transporter CrcB [Ottowia sp.]MBP8161191.1 fluoride efflux transporter CrcB [Ottowia sp.]MBP8860569.1 fluoride efflux transporter CrcB [Ottowia sp.]
MHAVFAICLGACVGALARWRLGLWLNHPGAFMPWGTLAANLIGGYLVGLILAWAHHADLAPFWRLILVTGFLGALTTFSSFSAEVVEMALADRWGAALSTAALHLLGSLALTWLGIQTARFFIAASD